MEMGREREKEGKRAQEKIRERKSGGEGDWVGG